MDAQWPQGIGGVVAAKTMENSKEKAQKDDQQVLNCPRCNSTNAKFCYYNNYSLSQPRYFCKTCRRYWTSGGSIRNVPVGGGSRKTKRSSSPSSSSSKKLARHNDHPQSSFQNPKINECQDLNLACPYPIDKNPNPNPNPNPSSTSFGLFPSYVDGYENGYGNMQEVEENSGARNLFPIDDLKQGQGDSSCGYWNGMYKYT